MKKYYELVGSKTCTKHSEEDEDDDDSTTDHSRKLAKSSSTFSPRNLAYSRTQYVDHVSCARSMLEEEHDPSMCECMGGGLLHGPAGGNCSMMDEAHNPRAHLLLA